MTSKRQDVFVKNKNTNLYLSISYDKGIPSLINSIIPIPWIMITYYNINNRPLYNIIVDKYESLYLSYDSLGKKWNINNFSYMIHVKNNIITNIQDNLLEIIVAS